MLQLIKTGQFGKYVRIDFRELNPKLVMKSDRGILISNFNRKTLLLVIKRIRFDLFTLLGISGVI